MEAGLPSDNNGPQVLSVMWSLFSVAASIVCIRLWIRIHLTKQFGWDDAFIVLAVVFGCVNVALLTVAVYYGLGRRQAYLDKSQVEQVFRYTWLSQPFHIMCINWGKVSAILLIIRIIESAKRQVRYFYAAIVFLTIINTGCVCIMVGQCQPPDAFWNPRLGGKCWSPSVLKNYTFLQSACSAVSDLFLAAYPIFVVSRLQMPRRVKLAITSVLLLGLVAFAGAIIKASYLPRLTVRADYPWATADLVIWAVVEEYLVLIATCVPTLGPLIKHIRRTSTSENTASTYTRYLKKVKGRFNSSPKTTLGTVTADSVYRKAALWKNSKLLNGLYSSSPTTGRDSYLLSVYDSGVKQQQQTEAHSSQEAIVGPSTSEAQQGEAITKVTEVHKQAH
ncbi:integral membrane protein [Nannizzia gypsea CBS 118893]|uniref:Integral membrane protein n=1 Tax=Arthroderma gypseum (strain ATCC MYA-4604 / CBS 118893) TaxID=535722 RepID=E4V778_ARTGP|nr:integral membrane protein [Nannizzia gypsea CBS 118893]EFQ96944.1 integral membrane protein [Nannizzia gypsea CBS 118893]